MMQPEDESSNVELLLDVEETDETETSAESISNSELEMRVGLEQHQSLMPLEKWSWTTMKFPQN